MSIKTKKLLPFVVIIGSILFAALMISLKSDVETVPTVNPPKMVRVIKVEEQTVTLVVKTQGTVVPRTETSLVSQVAGQITKISPAFVSGGFFEKDDVLVEIDKRDYVLALKQADLQVAQAELRLKIEEQEAKVARQEWQRLNTGTPPPLVAREPQLLEAKAMLGAAKASMELAYLNIERTEIKAPYAGRIRAKSVDVGQYVNPGTAVAAIYAIDYAEVRLPLPDKELAYIDFPYDFRGNHLNKKGPEVILKANFAGKERVWKGYITRIEGEIDPLNRMIHVVARVDDPYVRNRGGDKPPFTVGMFVHAEIQGLEVENLVAIPRTALRNNNQVLIVDPENRLRFRNVEIFRLETEIAYISSGLKNGDQVCVSTLLTVVEGMPVEIYVDEK